MRSFKKLLALMLAVSMCVGSSMTVFAETNDAVAGDAQSEEAAVNESDVQLTPVESADSTADAPVETTADGKADADADKAETVVTDKAADVENGTALNKATPAAENKTVSEGEMTEGEAFEPLMGGATKTDAVAIALNTEVSDNLTSGSDNDWFYFDVPSDGMVSVNFSHTQYNMDKAWSVYLYDSSDKELAMLDEIGNNTVPVRLPAMGLPAGRYYVAVKPYGQYDWTEVTYKLNVRFTEATNWEKEFNDNIASANDIAVNTEYNGTTRSKNDSDYYKFTLAGDGVVNVTFSHDVYDKISSDSWEIKLYDGNNNELFNCTEKGNGTKEQKYLNMGLSAGTYYLSVNAIPAYSAFVPYKFKVNYESSAIWEKELNDDLTKATLIPIKTGIQGSLRNKNDADCYKIETTKQGALTINFTPTKIESDHETWKIKLYDSNNRLLLERDAKGNEARAIDLPAVGINAGTYYISVEAYSASLGYWSDVDYVIKADLAITDLWEAEPNPESSPTTVKFNKDMHGTIVSKEDVDAYTFTLDQTSKVGVRFSHDYLDRYGDYWIISLFNEDRTNKIFENTNAARSRKTDLYENELPAGKYCLIISGNNYSWDPLEYTFSVSTAASESLNGLVEVEKGAWYLYKNGQVDTGYTGLYYQDGFGWWLIREGKVNFSYNGLYNDSTYGWWMIKNGAVDFSYTAPGDGLSDTGAGIYLYRNGSIDESYNGLYCDEKLGWKLLTNGKVDSNYTDLYCDATYGWWKISSGSVDFNYNDLYNSSRYGWWKVNGGTVDFGYSELYCSQRYGWWKINGGAVDFGFNDLYCSPTYGWWKISNGMVDFGYNDLFGSPLYGWWKINGGTVDFGYNDLFGSPFYGWWLVTGGAVNFGYTDLFCSPSVGWWKVNGGTVDFGYTDLYGSPTYGWWKINGGAVDFGYTGTYYSPTYNYWNIVGGAVQF